ncbi:hypothetical protein ACLM5J_12425 [Nocardioides sp. Bht2]|uniref:hypothetical protein n=1 Tax=Nocardioides sp. Bht2 TaxID=3392297 RepID=UPI0039B66DB9
MNDLGWQALAAALTLLGGAWTFYAARTRGAAATVRGAGLTLLAPAALFTGTLEMAGEMASAVADWASGLVFSPVVWLGVLLAGLAALLLVLAGWLDRRGGDSPTKDGTRSAPPISPGGRGAPAIDDDLSEIEALLKKRGIT